MLKLLSISNLNFKHIINVFSARFLAVSEDDRKISQSKYKKKNEKIKNKKQKIKHNNKR